MTRLRFETTSAAETQALGQRIAALLRAGDLVLLHGDLGSGKTTLVQGIATAMGVQEQTQSPTFSLVVDTRLPNGTILRHIDLYRLDDPTELETLGFDELAIDDRAIVVVEWPERAVGILPDAYLLIELQAIGADRRRITLRPVGPGDRFSELAGG